MKLRFLATLLVFLSAPFGFAEGGTTNDFENWIRERAASWPMIELTHGDIPYAKIQTLPRDMKTSEREGKFYSGFRFRTPSWLDGPMLWLYGVREPVTERSEGFSWFVVSEKPQEEKLSLYFSREGAKRCTYFLKRCPGYQSFVYQSVPRDYLKPEATYIVWMAMPTDKVPDAPFAVTFGSKRGRGEYGLLPTGPPDTGPNNAYKTTDTVPEPIQDALDRAFEVSQKSGIPDALKIMDAAMDAHIQAGSRFRDQWETVWREAQLRSGREHPEWDAALYEWLQNECIKVDAKQLATSSAVNACSALSTIHQYGRAWATLGPFFDQMSRRKMSCDPTVYPDLGPAFEKLPEVRHRRFPMESEIWILSFGNEGWPLTTREMPAGFGSIMRHLSSFDRRAGHWKAAIERSLWVCEWVDRGLAKFEPDAAWYSNRAIIPSVLEEIGLYELADEEQGKLMASERADIYDGRAKVEAEHERIKISVRLGTARTEDLARLDALYQKEKNNIYQHRSAWEGVELTKAKVLLALDRADEAREILTRLAAEPYQMSARFTLLKLRLEAGESDGLEAGLLALLEDARKDGDKLFEIRLYRLYSSYLLKNGRFAEALAMQEEAVRLTRSFDLIGHLPETLAELAVVRARCGDAKGSQEAALDARSAATSRDWLPARLLDEVDALLKGISADSVPAPSPSEDENTADLQPEAALVISLAGKPAKGRATVSNPGQTSLRGAIGFSGMPVDASWNAEAAEARVKVGVEGSRLLQDILLGPGQYATIDLEASETVEPGELAIIWRHESGSRQTSTWTFEEGESGVESAVIDAGSFIANPFYSVPIHHHFQALDAALECAALRIRSSAPARIELYDAENRLVLVDANGNGDLSETGDAILHDADTDGMADISLKDGQAGFRIQCFPAEGSLAEPMKVIVESRFEGAWEEFAIDTIKPAAKR
ncbi:tetratricopeptide repeat protein [Haloferula sargassicola]|uniref:Tetratricopeptide repeat protein n=1 Tax=Haloferula sargassicola TaxID=490096 RepID=A0ABP9URA3_9BACT